MTENTASRRRRAAGGRWSGRAGTPEGALSDRRRAPITLDRIVETAFGIVEGEGFEALTMRRVAAALQTGPASLYAHVRNKAELDDLLIGDLCARVALPVADSESWVQQFRDVCGELRDQYLRYPGISGAALATDPNSLDTLELSEGMLAILLAGGVPAQTAAWAIDAAFLYVSAYSLERSLRMRPGAVDDERILDRAATTERLSSLPVDRFPNTVAHAGELTSGDGHDRFNFTLDLMLQGLAAK